MSSDWTNEEWEVECDNQVPQISHKTRGIPGKIKPEWTMFTGALITEDLTRINYDRVQSLTRYKRRGDIDSVWTRDGTIFAKRRPDQRPMKIRTDSDINVLFDRR